MAGRDGESDMDRSTVAELARWAGANLVISGSVFKLTLAPQITPEPLAFSRPSIRAYFTYAWWDDELEGAVGGPSFSNDTEGLAAGVQVEAWW